MGTSQRFTVFYCHMYQLVKCIRQGHLTKMFNEIHVCIQESQTIHTNRLQRLDLRLNIIVGLIKVKSAYEPRRPIRPALISGFRSMKRLGVFLFPPGWDASPIAGLPPALNSPVPIYTPGWREAP